MPDAHAEHCARPVKLQTLGSLASFVLFFVLSIAPRRMLFAVGRV